MRIEKQCRLSAYGRLLTDDNELVKRSILAGPVPKNRKSDRTSFGGQIEGYSAQRTREKNLINKGVPLRILYPFAHSRWIFDVFAGTQAGSGAGVVGASPVCR